MIKKIAILLFLFTLGITYAHSQSDTLRFMTYNILHGATTKGDFNLDAIAQPIQDLNPHFVAMQEVDFRTNRARKYDLVTELGWRTKMAPLFARAMPYDGGEYGEGVLSKYSFISTRNYPLPHSMGSEPRAALSVIVSTPSGDTLQFVGTHLDHVRNSPDRIAQAKELVKLFADSPYPTIIAGDLNATPDSEAMKILFKAFTPASSPEKAKYTFPSDHPRIKIDYVLYSHGHNWEVGMTKVVCDTYVTDHCYYYVDLILE